MLVWTYALIQSIVVDGVTSVVVVAATASFSVFVVVLVKFGHWDIIAEALQIGRGVLIAEFVELMERD